MQIINLPFAALFFVLLLAFLPFRGLSRKNAQINLALDKPCLDKPCLTFKHNVCRVEETCVFLKLNLYKNLFTTGMAEKV